MAACTILMMLYMAEGSALRLVPPLASRGHRTTEQRSAAKKGHRVRLVLKPTTESRRLSETIAAFIIYLLTGLFTGVFALSIPAIFNRGPVGLLITSFGCAAFVAVGGAIMEMN